MIGQGVVLVAGAINTDLVARVHKAPAAGETVTGTAFDVFGGGKGANQALACARSGAHTTMLGALGADDFGRQRLADLQADRIDVASVELKPGVASGVALITVEEGGQNRIAYVPGATATVPPSVAVAAFERADPSVVLSTLELPDDALGALFATAKQAGARVILNATPESSTGKQFLPVVDALIVNEVEALELLDEAGAPDGWIGVAGRLRALGPAWVIITLGAEGAIADLGGATMRVASPAVDVVDTTGAGDAFCGAFAARLAAGASASEALRAGVAAGALAVTVAGAQRSMPRRDAVEQMLTRVTMS